jgi:hypothetical protein
MKTNQPLLANLTKSTMQQLTSTVKETVATVNNHKTNFLSNQVLQSILRGRKSRSSSILFDIAGNAL